MDALRRLKSGGKDGKGKGNSKKAKEDGNKGKEGKEKGDTPKELKRAATSDLSSASKSNLSRSSLLSKNFSQPSLHKRTSTMQSSNPSKSGPAEERGEPEEHTLTSEELRVQYKKYLKELRRMHQPKPGSNEYTDEYHKEAKELLRKFNASVAKSQNARMEKMNWGPQPTEPGEITAVKRHGAGSSKAFSVATSDS
ncbi:hypothetical protein ACMFMG_000985 [Clarireedia jacksonii]